MRRVVIFDLDGTLCDIQHRLHHIIHEPNDWEAFYKACVEDIPITAVVEIAQALRRQGYLIYIFSGRSNVVQQETIQWLWDHKVEYDRLVMRQADDNRPARHLKEMFLMQYFPDPEDRELILGVFDDHDQSILMYQAFGVACFKVQSHLNGTEDLNYAKP